MMKKSKGSARGVVEGGQLDMPRDGNDTKKGKKAKTTPEREKQKQLNK